jgi:hypothetical protein
LDDIRAVLDYGELTKETSRSGQLALQRKGKKERSDDVSSGHLIYRTRGTDETKAKNTTNLVVLKQALVMVITQESNAGFDCVPGDEGAAPGVKATETFGRESRFDDLDWTWRLSTYVSGRFGELDGRDSIRERNESRRRGKRATFSPLTSDANWDWVLTNSVG